METPKEYYYTYYSYEEWGRGYFGSRGCKCLPEQDVTYLGSSKDKNFNPTYKIILKDDYATREEAYADEIILQQYYKVVENPHFANRAYQTSTKFYVPTEQAKENGRNNKKNGKGIFAQTFEERSEIAKRNSQKNKENKVGIFALTKEQLSENGKKGGKKSGQKCKEFGMGIYGISPEQRKENAIKGGKTSAKIINSQKWECCETGYVSTAAGVVSYQKGKGIDTSKKNRKRIE